MGREGQGIILAQFFCLQLLSRCTIKCHTVWCFFSISPCKALNKTDAPSTHKQTSSHALTLKILENGLWLPLLCRGPYFKSEALNCKRTLRRVENCCFVFKFCKMLGENDEIILPLREYQI